MRVATSSILCLFAFAVMVTGICIGVRVQVWACQQLHPQAPPFACLIAR